MRVLTTRLRVEIENEMRVFLESLNLEIEVRLESLAEVCVADLLAFPKDSVTARKFRD